MAPTSGPSNPFGSFNFLVEIDALTSAHFAECTGLGTSVDVIEYREGGDLGVRKLPGRAHASDITLRRGITRTDELQKWHANVLRGTPDRRNGSIVLLDNTMAPVVRWTFTNAFPRRWEGPHLNASGSDIAIETLVLCCERLERE
jgi:phage tail-like protein